MRCYDACDMIWVEFFSQTLASYVMLRVHRVEVIFWWFKVLGSLQGAHCEYQKALDGHKNDSYAHKAVDRPRKFMAWTACMVRARVLSWLRWEQVAGSDSMRFSRFFWRIAARRGVRH